MEETRWVVSYVTNAGTRGMISYTVLFAGK